jgi:ubiquinone/menaquinone biosynthesis C-methylase UbiE
MKEPLLYRKGIPFFYHKTEADFQKDPYERYDSMVLRQSALHLADELWGRYPFQPIFDFAEEYCTDFSNIQILETGCGTGRWIATLAQRFPEASCYGIDYSYQMLKQAKGFWIDGKEILIDLSEQGFVPPIKIRAAPLKNLHLGLAKAEELPFEDNSLDVVINSFLLDRLDNPQKGLEEMYRVLKPKGTLILVTPLNFKQADHWKALYPPEKLSDVLNKMGFNILKWQDDIIIEEPLDVHGNMLNWKCLGLVARTLPH